MKSLTDNYKDLWVKIGKQKKKNFKPYKESKKELNTLIKIPEICEK